MVQYKNVNLEYCIVQIESFWFRTCRDPFRDITLNQAYLSSQSLKNFSWGAWSSSGFSLHKYTNCLSKESWVSSNFEAMFASWSTVTNTHNFRFEWPWSSTLTSLGPSLSCAKLICRSHSRPHLFAGGVHRFPIREVKSRKIEPPPELFRCLFRRFL